MSKVKLATLSVTLVSCLASLPLQLRAQATATDEDWNALSGLDAGTPLIVQTTDDETIRTLAFVRRDRDIILLSNDALESQEYRRELIAAVWRFGPPKRRRNALFGLLIGAAVGAGITAIAVNSGRDFAHPGAMGFVGGAVGAGIGAWVSSPSRALLYSRDPAD